MKKTLAPFLFFMIAFLISCECENPIPAGIANFQYEKDAGDYKKVTFANLSVNYTSVSWNFGDDSALSGEENPVHSFSNEGTFVVKLTAIGKDGKAAEKTANVVIAKPISEVIANFQYEKDASDYKKVTFTNLSVNHTTLAWNFGDNTAVSTEANPAHIFPNEGTFTVKLTATGEDGKTSEKTVNVVIVNPLKTFVIQPNGSFGKDALLHGLSSEVNTNRGDNAQFVADAWTFSGTPGVVRSVIEFDLSAIPDNATISHAFLSLYAWDTDTGLGRHSTLSGSNTCVLQRVTSSWNENTVTWNTQPATTTVNQVTLAASTSSTQNYTDIDVTSLVKDMKNNPSTSFGFMIKLQTESYYRLLNFCSSDHSNPTLRPKLVVHFKTN